MYQLANWSVASPLYLNGSVTKTASLLMEALRNAGEKFSLIINSNCASIVTQHSVSVEVSLCDASS